jgi:hypothetical protein
LLGPVSCSSFPDWLVRRIADHANADNPRDSHQENPFSSGPGQLASHDHDGRDYLHRHLAPVLAPGCCFGLHSFATAVLANSFRDPALLRYPYSSRENVVDAQVVAINCRKPERGRSNGPRRSFPPMLYRKATVTLRAMYGRNSLLRTRLLRLIRRLSCNDKSGVCS